VTVEDSMSNLTVMELLWFCRVELHVHACTCTQSCMKSDPNQNELCGLY
jgi:hypothetical protein